MKQFVVVGNGVAAVGCIEGIRSVDSATPITVVSAENHAVYCRPLISYYLEGKTDVEKMKYRPADFYDQMNCQVLYGVTAETVNAAANKVTLNNNSSLPYSALCLATGSSPFIPPFAGIDQVSCKYTFMTLDDALALEKVVNRSTRVLIIGAGLIGLKCAEGLLEKAGSITICDLAGHVLSSILDSECAAIVQKHLQDHGIRFMLGDSVASFSSNMAYMKSGAAVEFDVLVLAVGVRANTALAKEAGIEVNKGILVDDHMQTTLTGIYAAGDCTESRDISSGENRVLAIMPNAYMQGKCAGINMAGHIEQFNKGMPMNSIGFCGLHVMTAGSRYAADDGGEVYEEKAIGRVKKLFSRNGLLTGFIFVGHADRVGIYTSLIREQVPLNTINYEMLQKVVSLAAFSSEYRKTKLGGVV